MMSRHFHVCSEPSGAITERLPHAKNQLSMPGSFFNRFVTDIYIYIYIYILTIKTRLMFIRIVYTYTSALRLLALRGWRTLCVLRRLYSVAWGHID